jgi:hypothetical protein
MANGQEGCLRRCIQIQSLRMREKADVARAQALREISPGLILRRGGRRSRGRSVTPLPHRLRIAAEKTKTRFPPFHTAKMLPSWSMAQQ